MMPVLLSNSTDPPATAQGESHDSLQAEFDNLAITSSIVHNAMMFYRVGYCTKEQALTMAVVYLARYADGLRENLEQALMLMPPSPICIHPELHEAEKR